MANPITAIGLMSGTSMDGIDVALIRTDGADMVEALAFESVDYGADQRALLTRAMSQSAGLQSREERPGSLSAIEADITRWHAEAVNRFCASNGLDRSPELVVGFHGQTVLHRPDIGMTVQLGDGQALADATGCRVIADMRANDMKHGGQGAPWRRHITQLWLLPYPAGRWPL